MTEQSQQQLANLPASAATHFNLLFYWAVLHLTEHAAQLCGGQRSLAAQFPFLNGYWRELGEYGLEAPPEERAASQWGNLVEEWERSVRGRLPLRALMTGTGLAQEALLLLLTVGLPQEDARFGLLFEQLQGVPGGYRPLSALATTWWSNDGPGGVRALLRRLLHLGLLQAANPDAPPSDWLLQAPTAVWEAMHGDPSEHPTSWLLFHASDTLPSLDSLILPQDLLPNVEALPGLLASGEAQAVVVRGPQHNGRRTLLSAVARELGLGVLEMSASALDKTAEERWRVVGPLALLLHTLPVLVLDLAPGEGAQIPPLPGYSGPLGIVMGRQGGVSGPGVQRAVTLTLPTPGPAARRTHWRRSLPEMSEMSEISDIDQNTLGSISERFRLTSGNIRRVAPLAHTYATLRGRTQLEVDDVQQATRALNRQALDTLATPVPSCGDWSHLAVNPETRRELLLLESRCRQRERLPEAAGGAFGAQLGVGVRALFSGPSGTGKSLAARLLASALQMDLYRLDLASVVNKYIGETEKNLDQAFARAEELDVVLLLDEGDALLTQRTNVHSSNDRYANLETNYLLQRLESFEGILLVTTNAGARIDDAFQRRMDVVIAFQPPDVAEREAIWRLHLPPTHAVPAPYLSEVARRVALNGGQIRNAALHATLLALTEGAEVGSPHIEAAVRREYRKTGAVCPLRPLDGAAVRAG